MSLPRITLENLDQAFDYAPWDDTQQKIGMEVKAALKEAARVMLLNVPESPLRTRALNGLFDVRMLCNAAITHEKKEG